MLDENAWIDVMLSDAIEIGPIVLISRLNKIGQPPEKGRERKRRNGDMIHSYITSEDGQRINKPPHKSGYHSNSLQHYQHGNPSSSQC